MVDITVRSEHELLFTSFLIIVSAIINAIIYGQFANLTEDLKENSNIFLRKLDLVNSVMASEHLPMELKDNVREHILTTHWLKKLQDEQLEFQGNISSSMKELVRCQIFQKIYRKSPLAWYMRTNLYKEWLEDNYYASAN